MHQKLQDKYLVYNQIAGRCKLELKPKELPSSAAQLGVSDQKKEKEFKNFYIPPKIPLLEDPERQKKFRKEYIAEVGAKPRPEQISLMADSLHFEMLSTIADHSKPSLTRKEFQAFFKRRAVGLRHKKYKMLGRWANQHRHCQSVEQSGNLFDRMVGRLQQELDSSMDRSERLGVEDSYDAAVDTSQKRPQPTSTDVAAGKEGTLLYVEAPGKYVNSVIRQDDIEVYLRLETYRSKLFRLSEKLVDSIKWLPYSHRFDIWKESRILIHAGKQSYINEREQILQNVTSMIRPKLVESGVADEKLLELVINLFTKHLLGQNLVSRLQQYVNGQKSRHQKPPFLFTSNVEMKSKLLPIAKDHNLSIGDIIDTDDGFQFTYQVQGLFPAKFQQQVLMMQFDWHDSGEGTQADTDILLIQKLSNELSLDKNEMLSEMARQAETERKKSILGQIKSDQPQGDGASSKASGNEGQKEDVARENLKRRIKEMNFFSLDESTFKVKKADWLQYVCWSPSVPDILKKQNHIFSSNEENPIDSLLLSAFEFIDVNEAGAANKILEDSATAHVRKVRGYFTELSQQITKPSYPDKNTSIEAMIKDATLGEQVDNSKKEQKSDEHSHYAPSKVEDYLQKVDPLKQHLIKSFYTLRFLKSRDTKAKMIQALNYFRGIQRRLAHDVREFFTRERALGGQQIEEALIGPQFGKDEFGNLKAKKGGSEGPGGINANSLKREQDDGNNSRLGPDRENPKDPVSLKGYKYNRRYNPALSSTCPCVPRFHSTFGRPTLYEEVSTEMENTEDDAGRWRPKAKSIVSYKDRLILNHDPSDIIKSEIKVLDEHGTPIVYEESVNDMMLLEEEMVKIGSYYLNKAELEQHMHASEQPSTMIDRGEIAHKLFEYEFEIQMAKASLVETLMEVYEHTYDPLESVRVLQIISDTMAIRPRMNLDATYFQDSYEAEINLLKEKAKFYKEVVNVQQEIEIAENKKINMFQELKLRKLLEFIQGKWTYEHTPEKNSVMGTKEESMKGQNVEVAKQGKRQAHMKEMQKQIALKEISERHITEFAGDQHTDFANVLGLPEVTAYDLFKKKGQQDPLVIDTISEHSHFSKQIEGYPWFFKRMEEQSTNLGLQTREAGITDFYESLCAVTRVYSAFEQSIGELSSVFRPESGLASTNLETAMIREARGRLRVIRKNADEQIYPITKSAAHIEEDFYLSNSDKLMYLMREFKSEMNPDTITTTASPLLVGKLDIEEIAKFDFPRLKQSEIDGYEDLTDEQLTEKMIALAKISISRKTMDRMKDLDQVDLELDDEEQKNIKSPSMLVMACNTVEAIRLRRHLIKTIHECDILEEIYVSQLGSTNTPVGKIILQEGIPFETSSISKGNVNFVDTNDGTKMTFDLAFREFDSTLKSCLDFKSDSCIKGLMTDIGVEELRAVLHYQMMQKQLLTISVMRNQALMDGPQLGLVELQLLQDKKQIAVPGSIVRLQDVFAYDGPHNSHVEKERRRLNGGLTKGVGDHIFNVTSRKSEFRGAVISKYNQTYNKILQSERSNETKLRILRSYRIKLLHDYCKEVMKGAYKSCIVFQTLLVCRELRRKSLQLPKEEKPLKMGPGILPELLPGDLLEAEEEPILVDLIKGKCKNIFYIPSSSEMMEATKSTPKEGIKIEEPQFKEAEIDQFVKSQVQIPNLNDRTEAMTGCRHVLFKEAYKYELVSYDLLKFYTNLLQIVTLEYQMGRNHAPGTQIIQMETQAIKGETTWSTNADQKYFEEKQKSLSDAPERVIQKIIHKKRAHVDLVEDLSQICVGLHKMNEFVKTNNSDQLRLSYLIELLQIQHNSSFLHFINGLENTLEIYLDHRSDDCFAKIQTEMFQLARIDQGFNLLGNGIYLNQGTRKAMEIDPARLMLQDYDEFEACYQPLIDENALVPPQLALVRRLYGNSARKMNYARSACPSLAIPKYSDMDCSFFNLDDEQRSFIATNFYQTQESMTEYLIFSGLIQDPNAKVKEGQPAPIIIARPKEILEAKIEFLSMKVEARHLQRVLMSWSICCAIPSDTESFHQAQTILREQTMLKVLLERDILTEQYYEAKEGRKDAEGGSAKKALQKQKALEKQTILESINPNTREHSIVMKLNQIKAEISVTNRVLDMEMIKISLDIIDREHGSLLAAFEQGAAVQVHAHVHPQQQFASTLFSSVDSNSHLDVVNKLTFVQSFLTKLRNRCTEVETLASGPGIVFSMKDFNECLQVFCQGLLKYGEGELRSRVETQHIRQNQYQHMLYMKEKQSLYYRKKCEQFLGDIDKLVNAKISQKGGQLIYELDVSQRELRVLRDNYRLMKKMMLEDLKHEYMKQIMNKDNKIGELRDKFKEHRERVSAETIVAVQSNFKDLEDKVDQRRRDIDSMDFGQKGVVKQSKEIRNLESFEQPTQHNQFDSEPRKDVLDLLSYIRKYKTFNMMKQVLSQEAHEKELANQRAQLTSNAALWDQLAEAEKREQITKQELTLTKLSLASYEKLIEKLQGQLENLNNQKARLQQYKNSKSKRIDELENKMKDLEILENIDLNRILTELKSRDKKIEHLEGYAPREDINQQRSYQQEKEIFELKKQLQNERELKLQAFDRLEGLRVEMRALEGKDVKSDLWKDKCRDLFDMCKDLERENEDLKSLVKDANQANLLQTNTQLDQFAAMGIRNNMGQNKTIGNSQYGAGSNFNGSDFNKIKSSRTIGLNEYANDSKYNTRMPTRDPEFISSNIGRQFLRKSHGGATAFGGHQDTVHSENFNSYQHSGGQGQLPYGEAELLSLGSGGVMGEPTIVTAGAGAAYLSSGVLGGGGVFQGVQPNRGIMTAGGGQRPRPSNRQGKPNEKKRILTSQGPAGANARIAARASHGSHPAKQNGPKTTSSSVHAQNRVNYAMNQPSLAVQGKNADTLPRLPNQQPVNVNITYNTTHINVPK